ncbi:MAG: TonB-dependent receptor plug domain-containing protein [Bacteroidales bacterium]|nr:TonB-dependent receptor plug domain-containing protein [Candidatus Cryptobacteroides onthequi]
MGSTATRLAALMAAAALACACGTAGRTPEDIERRAGRRAENAELRRQAQISDREEVVGIGYGTIHRRQNTYSVERVTPDERQMSGYRNILDYLRGRVPGLTIGNSVDGNMPSMTIRGKNSINSSTEPLFIVDGTPTDNIMWINPQDVASVDVLKDASASIYGSRGANGVIIINTKTAREVARQQLEKKELSTAEKAARKARKATKAR